MPPKPSSTTTTTTTTTESNHLLTTTTQTSLLLSRFLTALSDSSFTPTQPLTFSPLTLLAQSSSLIRAHTTKLSLLLLNKPFTPSAIRKVLEQLNGEALPGLAAGVQLMQGMREFYGVTMVEEVGVRVRRVYRELGGLVDEVVRIVQGSDGEKNRDTLASTGVVWAACDEIGELERMGVPGLLVKKVALWREMLEDAIAELREWSEDDDEDDEEEEEEETATSDDDEASTSYLDDASLPKHRTDLKQTVDLALKRLKLTSTLYAAITKRRLKTLVINAPVSPSTPSTTSTTSTTPTTTSTSTSTTMTKVDLLMEKLKRIPEETDELASAFYDLDDEEARKVLEGICALGKECVDLVKRGWREEDQEDEFTKWAGKWIEAIGKEEGS